MSAAHRFCVRFSDDSGAFVKAATDQWTERQLRVEQTLQAGQYYTDKLKSIQRKWKIIQTVREKFTCRECEKITQPPAPFHTIPRGWAGPSLLAMILFEKFGQHQPLNRQCERFACLSNNAAERAVRGIALGRRAWLFAGSDRGGERAAFMYSLIVSAKMNNIDPQAWLADVLQRLADHPAFRLVAVELARLRTADGPR